MQENASIAADYHTRNLQEEQIHLQASCFIAYTETV